MRGVTLLIVATLLAGLALPTVATSSVHERNVAFLLEHAGLDAMPSGTAFVQRGTGTVEMPASEAIGELASLAGTVDLGAVVAGSGAEPLDGVTVGDLWVIFFGTSGASCNFVSARVGLAPVAPHPQVWLYPDHVGHGEALGATGYVFDWTTKDVLTVTDPSFGPLFSPFCVQIGPILVGFILASGYVVD